MALVVGSATVATGMSPVVEEALYADDFLIDGITFTSKHEVGNAGQIQVVKYAADNSIEPTAPGSNFSDDAYANTVVDINCNNAFQKSVKVPAYYEATMPIDVRADRTWDVTRAVATGRQKSAIAALVKQGTDANDTTAVTKSNVKDLVINGRQALIKKNARPNVIIASPEVYGSMLKAAGSEYVPAFNDEVIRAGRIGTFMGILWFESSLLDGTSSYKYLKADGTAETVDISKVDYILYDGNAFSIIDKLVALRVVDSELFMGSKIQEEIDTGFLVTNADCVLVKFNA